MCLSGKIGNYFCSFTLKFATFELEFWGGVVVFLAQKGCVLESLVDDSLMLYVVEN